jgi:hypothetical protein
MGEIAALSVVAVEVRKHGRCTLHLNTIAALAGVCRTTVKNALRQAEALGFIRIMVRRLTAWRCDSNVVTVTDSAWAAWLRLRRAGVRSKPCLARSTSEKKGAAYRPQRAAGKERGQSGEPHRPARRVL